MNWEIIILTGAMVLACIVWYIAGYSAGRNNRKL